MFENRRLDIRRRVRVLADIQRALMAKKITSVGLVQLYLKRIKTYKNTCVSQPIGILGPITTIPRAGQVNALSTLNLRPPPRKIWGFEERKARSMTDMEDNNPNMPEVLEVAAAQDRQLKQTGACCVRDGKDGTRLIGPIQANLPVGLDFIARPFDEAMLIRIASAFEAATRHRKPPPDFGPVSSEP
jgi:hypothetical protein